MVNPVRVQKITEKDYSNGTVIYEMCRELRAHDNDALLFAQDLAKSNGCKLVVHYRIYNYLWQGATARFYDWVIASLKEVEATLRVHAIPLVIIFEDNKLYARDTKISHIPHDTGAVVIEEIPLHFARKWKDIYLAHHNTIPLYEVDARNCIPVWELSHKQEFAARTIRSKVHAKLGGYLEEYDKLTTHTANADLLTKMQPIDWNDIRKKIICDESVAEVDWIHAGEKAAHKQLTHFLSEKLQEYDESRNSINIDGQSNLSPYISHGNISRRRIVLELLRTTGVEIRSAFDPVQNGSNGKLGSIAAFIEECVVRAELCENFCYYNHAYDKVTGFPAWAKETLDAHKHDAREYTYTYKQLEKGETHDRLWNAAQLQMVQTGKMHGYMRMYWAKKILEWTKSPEDAMKFAVKLNDTYELDGRDVGGYVGCAWSIGGVHDRPWFTRPIFGTIRYMAVSGVEKRGSIEEYITKFASPPKLV